MTSDGGTGVGEPIQKPVMSCSGYRKGEV